MTTGTVQLSRAQSSAMHKEEVPELEKILRTYAKTRGLHVVEAEAKLPSTRQLEIHVANTTLVYLEGSDGEGAYCSMSVTTPSAQLVIKRAEEDQAPFTELHIGVDEPDSLPYHVLISTKDRKPLSLQRNGAQVLSMLYVYTQQQKIKPVSTTN